MSFDIIDLILAVYFFAPLVVLIFAAGFYAGRLKERTLAQAAMINAMRCVRELDGALTEEDHKGIAARLRQKMKEADEAWIPKEMSE